jgi:hypothetical protein
MAKQMKRVEKRYVPQQESFRQLPGLRPQAEPQAAVATPAPDSGAERLRELAESLAAGNKALGDFFTMEKSFEETNRAEAKVRGRLGLPEGEGRGFLDYGVRYGYEQGKALRDAEDVAIEYNRVMEENKSRFVPENFKSSDEVRAFSDKVLDDILKERDINLAGAGEAYMGVIGPEVAKLKVEGRVKALSLYDDQIKLGNINVFTDRVRKTMDAEFIPYIKGLAADPTRLMDTKDLQFIRDKMTKLSKEASEVYRIDRDAANVLMVETMTSGIQDQITLATADGGSWKTLADLEQVALGIFRTVDIPDASGFRLTTTKGDPETVKAIGNLRATVTSLSDASDRIREKIQKRESDKLVSNEAIKIFNKEQTIEEGFANIQRMIKSGLIDNEVALKTITQLHQVYETGAVSQVSREEAMKYVSMALSGQLSPTDIWQVAYDNKLPKELMSQMMQARSAYQADVSFNHSMVSFAQSQLSYDRESRMQEWRLNKTLNATSFQNIVDKHKLSGEELSFVQYSVGHLVNDPAVQVDPTDLEDAMLTASKHYSDINQKFAPTEASLVSREIDAEGKLASPRLKRLVEIQKKITSKRKSAAMFPVGSSEYKAANIELFALDEELRRLSGKGETPKPVVPPPTGGQPVWQNR